MRTRIDDQLSDVNTETGYVAYNGSVVYGTPSKIADQGLIKTTTDVVTPNFAARSARGEVINNPFYTTTVEEGFTPVAEYRQHKTASGSGSTAKTYFGNVYYTDLNTYILPPWVDRSNLRTLAGTQAKAGIMPADVMALVEIAEAKSTMQLITKPLDDTHRFLDRVKRSKGFRRYGGSLGGYIAANWLKYRYGLTPLALSIQDVWQLAIQDKTSRRRTSRGYAQAQSTDTDTLQYTYKTSWNASVAREAELKCSVRAGVLYDWEFNWTTASGVSFREIPVSLLELVPYSFVVGWFLNTSEVLRALTPAAGTRVLATWTTERTEYSGISHWTHTWKAPSGYAEDSTPEYSFNKRVTTKARSPGISVGLASKIPTFDLQSPREWKHFADSLALVWQRLQ